jgi:predicted small metal-binding protein
VDPCTTTCRRCNYFIAAPDSKSLLKDQWIHAHQSHKGVMDFLGISRISREDYILLKTAMRHREFWESFNSPKH